MPLPQISIEFKSTAISAIQRGSRGVVALILVDPTVGGFYRMTSVADIPTNVSAANKKQIELAFVGGVNPPQSVVAFFLPSTVYDAETDTHDFTIALNYLEGVKFDYLAVPDITENDTIDSWVKSQRQNGKKIKAVLPNVDADHEGIINFTTDSIVVGDTTYTTAEFCSRIAGLLAGTPLQVSATFQVLPDVDDVPKVTKADLDDRIDNGEFVIYNDGEKVKVARAVNSLQTTTADKGEDWKKIKIVDILDLVYTDIRKTAEDNYIGKYANSYDNKVLLISAINGYLKLLEADGVLDANQNVVGINVVKQEAYLKSIGVDTTGMNEQEIKEANTKDKVFLEGTIKPLDAIEDISLDFLI